MPAFTFAYNQRTTYYDVHAAGCAHLSMEGGKRHPSLVVMVTDEATDAKSAATKYESENEGCLTDIKPCARKATT
jgi:hypothetical protein